MSGFSRVWAVAWREFRYTALTKSFVFGVLIAPILMIGLFAVVPLLLDRETPPLEGTVAIVDPEGTVAAELAAEFGRLAERPAGPAAAIGSMSEAIAMPGPVGLDELDFGGAVRLDARVEPDPAAAEALAAEVRDGKLLALATVTPAALEPGATGGLTLLVRNDTSPKHTRLFERSLRDATVRARVAAGGDDFARISRLLERPPVATSRVSPRGETNREIANARMIIPVAFMMLLWVVTFSCGQFLLTTTIEEKGNRVMEVLLSAVSPMQLLGGKILGQAMVALVMLVMYGGMIGVGLSALAMLDLIGWEMLVYLALYFVMAYFMVSAMMVAVGSAVTNLQEAQALMTPVMLVLIVPMMLWLPVSDSPNGTLATVTSLVPPLVPFIMILRVSTSTEPVAAWQVAASLAIGFGSVFAMVWAAARIFRVGILMQGKPPTPRELLRWVRMR
jgi:ABC-2 type transport system permease protein